MLQSNIKLGTIAQARFFNGHAPETLSEKYRQLLAENFRSVGMMAFGQMPFIASAGADPDRDYYWADIDAFVEWTSKHGIDAQYNTVLNCHPQSFPDWYFSLPTYKRIAALKKHVQAVIKRYKHKIQWFKLVNEATAWSDNFLGTDEKRATLISRIFMWAKEEYPEGTFVLNDHIPFLHHDPQYERYVALIKNVVLEGAPLDAVGIEAHVGYRPIPFQLPSDDQCASTLETIHDAAGVPIYITEFDISYNNSPLKPYPGSVIDPQQSFQADKKRYINWYAYQGYAYEHFYTMCQKREYIHGLTFWGFVDGYLPDIERLGIGLFDKELNPKPAYFAMRGILSDQRILS